MAVSQATETSSSLLVERWRRAYATRLFVTDLLVLVVVVYGSQFLRFGASATQQRLVGRDLRDFDITYSLLSAMLIVAWMVGLSLYATRDHKVIGSGSTEYKRITDATIRVFGLLAILAFLAAVRDRPRLPAHRPADRARPAARQPLAVAAVAQSSARRRRVLVPRDPHGRAGRLGARRAADRP